MRDILPLVALAFCILFGVCFIFVDEIERSLIRRSYLRNMKKAYAGSSLSKSERLTERRTSLQNTMKEFDAKQKRKSRNARFPPLDELIRQSGMEQLTVARIHTIATIYSVIVTVAMWIAGADLVYLLPVAGFLFLLPPRWYLTRMRNRRLKAFLEEFPNAVDAIVRAVRSGLPITDGLAMIAQDSKEPLLSEFRRITESQHVGLTVPEAVQGLVRRVPCPEANFFSIVFQVQAQAGGNISDALGNLSSVLRERKRTRGKVRAMAAEAKASAWIIGLLPPLVAIFVSLSSPDYMTVLLTTSTGNIIVAVSVCWMLLGILIMSKMINFKI